jgi:hypothetical protein
MLNLLENVVQSRPGAEVSVEIEGFEGEWFDPYDVEGYLESRGIHIDPTVSFVEAEIDHAFDDNAVAVVHRQYSPNSSSALTSSRHSSLGGYNNNNNNNNPSTLIPASNSGSSSNNTSNNTSNNDQTSSSHSPPFFAEDAEQWSALQLLEPDLERWREVENPPVQNISSGLGNVGFSDADTGSWMNFFDSTASSSSSFPDQHQNGGSRNGQTAAAGMRNSGAGAGAGAFLSSDLYGANSGAGAGGGYEGAAATNTLPSPPSGRKVVIIDVAKFVKGELFSPPSERKKRRRRRRRRRTNERTNEPHTDLFSPLPNSPDNHRRLPRPHARFQATRRRSRAGRFFFRGFLIHVVRGKTDGKDGWMG